MPETVSLSPLTATLLLVIAVLAGRNFRQVWKAGGPRWKLWAYGPVAAAALLALAFIPLQV